MKIVKCILALFCLSFICIACGSNTKELQPEYVDTVQDDDNDEVVDHDLFSMKKGSTITLKSYAGGVDPVGTSIYNDFDGDGITNDKETIGNVWVADYPSISTNIETPITLKIEIQNSSGTETKDFSVNITSDDVTYAKEDSSDEVHKNEVNERTVQYQEFI